MNIDQKTFCSAPWFQIRTDNDGRFRTCCEIDPAKTGFKGRVSYNLKDDSAKDWLNSDYVKYLRQNLTSGLRLPECNKCWQQESSGLRSLRHIINQSVSKQKKINESWIKSFLKNKDNFENTFLISADIKISNVCNFSCAMCNPLDSTKIYAIWKKDIHHPIVQKHLILRPDLLNSAKSVFVENKNIDFLKEIMNYEIRHLKLLGGEPLLDEHLLDFLCAHNKNQAAKINLVFVTNGSVDLSKVKKRLAHYKTVTFVLSLEGIGDLQDYVRRGSNWQFIEKNVINYIKEFGTNHIVVHHTLQALTVLGLSDLMTWCEKFAIPMNFGILQTPAYLSVSAIPSDIKNQAIEQIKNLDCTIISPMGQNEMHLTPNGLIDLLQDTHFDQNLTTELSDFLQWYDITMQWQNLMPQWKSYLQVARFDS